MRARERQVRWARAASFVAAAGALGVTLACSSARDATTAAAHQATPAGTPVVVSCEPHQRTLVRPAVVNGSAVSQVECVAAAPAIASPAPVAAAPVASPAVYTRPAAPHAPAAQRVPQPVDSDLGDAEMVPATTTRQPIRTRQVIYDERPVKKTRSVKKSAIIIGSSAGVGAGVGAAIGGKKGALLGAAIGGGGATIWDQVTRRK